MLLLPLILACHVEDEAVPSSTATGDSDCFLPPQIVVLTESLGFGVVRAGDSASAYVEISNQGATDLHIEDVSLDAVGSPFSTGPLTSVLIQPGGTARQTVEFEPPSGQEYSATLRFDSYDPEVPRAEVPLSGEGALPLWTASDLDLGEVAVGCETTGAVRIEADEPLTLEALSLIDPTGAITVTDLSPAEIGGSLEVPVTAAPTQDGRTEATLSITTDDPYWPEGAVSIGLDAAFEELRFETWTVGDPRVDILFAVDVSASNHANVDTLESNIGHLVEALDDQGEDWQIAAVIEDDGCVLGVDWIDPSTADPVAAFALMTPHGQQEGLLAEKGFSLLEAALVASGEGGCNDGLVREGARLHVVGFSDEPEQSEGTVDDHLAVLRSYAAHDELLVVDAIGGDYPSGCGAAQAYTGFYDATLETGGRFMSMCHANWEAMFEAFASSIAATLITTRFPLGATPLEHTIEVTIDGSAVAGWSYEDGAIVFAAAPTMGAELVISYAVEPVCIAEAIAPGS